MTDDEWEKRLKFVIGHNTLAERDQGRLKLLLSFHDKSVGDPAPDWLEVITEYHTSSSKAKDITKQVFIDVTEDELNWLGAWMERRQELLTRIVAFERKLGIKRKIYNIDGTKRR